MSVRRGRSRRRRHAMSVARVKAPLRGRIVLSVILLLLFAGAIASGNTAQGKDILAAVQRFLLFYSGVFALIALTAAVGVGILATDRIVMVPGGRVVAQAVHRAVSLAALAFLASHIVLEILAHRSHVIDAFVPFLAHGRTFYIGLGTIASDLVVLLVVTGIARARFAARWPWAWRAIHATAYLAWPLSIVHGLLGGRTAKPYVDWSYGACVALVGLALVIRFIATMRGGKETAAHPVPDRASSAVHGTLPALSAEPLGGMRAALTRTQWPARAVPTPPPPPRPALPSRPAPPPRPALPGPPALPPGAEAHPEATRPAATARRPTATGGRPRPAGPARRPAAATGPRAATPYPLPMPDAPPAPYPEVAPSGATYAEASYIEAAYIDVPNNMDVPYPEGLHPDAPHPEAPYADGIYPHSQYSEEPYLEPSYPEPTYPEPFYPEVSYPEASYDGEAYDGEAAYSEASYPEEFYPEEAYPEGSYNGDGYSEEAYPDASYAGGAAYAEAPYPEEAYPEASYPGGAAYPEAPYPEEADTGPYPAVPHPAARYPGQHPGRGGRPAMTPRQHHASGPGADGVGEASALPPPDGTERR